MECGCLKIVSLSELVFVVVIINSMFMHIYLCVAYARTGEQSENNCIWALAEAVEREFAQIMGELASCAGLRWTYSWIG